MKETRRGMEKSMPRLVHWQQKQQGRSFLFIYRNEILRVKNKSVPLFFFTKHL